MIPIEVLLTIAEVAIGVLGFAAIATALRRRPVRRSDLISRFRLSILVATGSATLLFSFLPFVLRASRLEEPQVAAISSALLALATLFLTVFSFARQRSLFGSAILPETRLFDVGLLPSPVPGMRISEIHELFIFYFFVIYLASLRARLGALAPAVKG